ncbi:class I SAM-dependent methyltransferase [Aspergillus vadensis CBS 113365]|uniref:LaeA-like methyltransferase n=1 Tax=Aspergillus vadensis (strain CBS 113365 / IMI 142717 / IBT 24658) TaxID=1448311 RepID=A0A319BPT5_ASPVC|nr:hypothetical protein BO88DRAFT_483598 [Aspergillus vadensis CBS 113365]PYH74557.1 hypothetical protein BO88DRAFT_483598 [Aspergillus vadensis CBS 113365]
MASFGPEEVYLLGRSPDETTEHQRQDRLNNQQELFVELMGDTPIHPSIPTENIHAVADVATGTGIRIWLASVTDTLHPTPSNRLYLHGFDISPVQYPFTKDVNPSHETYFSVHDMRGRFLEEQRGRYDLVHLRLLAVALKEEDYPAVIRNVVMLLSVSRYTYSTLDKPHLHATASACILRLLHALFPKLIVSTSDGVEREKALEQVQRLLKFEGHVGRVSPLANLQVIVGRNPMSS